MFLIIFHSVIVAHCLVVRSASIRIRRDLVHERVDHPGVAVAQREATRIIVGTIQLVAACGTIFVAVTSPADWNAFVILNAFELVLLAELAILLVVAVSAVLDVVAPPVNRYTGCVQALELILVTFGETSGVVADG